MQKSKDNSEILQSKLARIELLEQKLKLKKGLPHIHGMPMYKWQYDFFSSRNKMCLLTAANQSGKSTCNIRKAIDWATDKSKWPELWPIKSKDEFFIPVIWYLYPDQGTLCSEFEEKWKKEFLPRGEFKNHPVYGWKEIVKNKVLIGVHFNLGTTIYFKTYSQNVENLQATTVSAIFTDEELPEELYSELKARLIATDGYFSMVFTATIGQEFWRLTMEPNEDEEEKFPTAFKQQISLFDCLKYHNSIEETPWSYARIQSVIDGCKNATEVKRRVYGKFVKEEGLKYFGFDRTKNYVAFPKKDGVEFTGVPVGWNIYSGVDIGSGGESGHPSAYCFVSASPDFTKLRMFKGRRLDGIQTTAGDTYRMYKEDRGKLKPSIQSYDWGSKDFHTIALRAGDNFTKAEKSHEIGEDILNTAFQLEILKIYQCPEHEKFCTEFETLSSKTAKKSAKDDAIDCLRYAVASIPIDWEKVFELVRKKKKSKYDDTSYDADNNDEKKNRPHDYINEDKEDNHGHEKMFGNYEEEFREHNELCGDF